MTRLGILMVVSWFALFCVVDLVQSQSDIRVKPQHQVITAHYDARRLPNGQTQILAAIEPPLLHVHKEAKERQLNQLKLLRQRKKKITFFQRQVKKCGLPLKFKLKKSDDGDGNEDEVRVKIPYGFGNEYFPDAQEENENFTGIEEKGNENEDDDDVEEPKTIMQVARPNPPANRQVPYYTPNLRPVMRYKIPPFKPIRGPVPMFGVPRTISRRPWTHPTTWRLARPGFAPIPYRLMEPIPGMVGGSPPIPHLHTKKEKHIPLTTAPNFAPQKDNTNLVDFSGKFRNEQLPKAADQSVQNYFDNQVTYKNPFSYNTKYRQSDFSMPGIYPHTSTAVPIYQREDEERVVTVTPSATWALNSPVFYQETQDNNQNQKVVKTSPDWVPILDNDNTFQISVESEPEIITGRYSMSELQGKLAEDVGTKILNKNNDKGMSQIPGGNSTRTRRS